MKTKTTIRIDSQLLTDLDQLKTKLKKSRSALIEDIVRHFLYKTLSKSNDNHKNELEKINRIADELNQEAMDVLSYQVKW